MTPGQALTLAGHPVETVKVLLLSEGGKVKIGKPYLKETLTVKAVEQLKGRKIRVFKYHAKANYRRARGYRSKLTKVVLDVKKGT